MEQAILPLVLYGAGKNAVKELELVKGQGKMPVGFCDADTKKHGSTCFGLPVMSVEQAREQFGEFFVHVTPGTPGSAIRRAIYDSLLEQGITKERIYNLQERKYKACRLLEKNLLIDQRRMSCCCHSNAAMNAPPEISLKENNWDLDASLSQWFQLRESLIASIRAGHPCACSGCSAIESEASWWPEKGALELISFALPYPCQLSCNYCDVKELSHNLDSTERQFMRNFNWKRFIVLLEKHGLAHPAFTSILFAGGEFTIVSNRKELLDAVAQYNTHIMTNMLTFDRHIAEALARPGCSLAVSIDAGTPKTYRKIKGADMFNEAWGNIKKYMSCGVKVGIKYIFMSENSNKTDIKGFMQKLLQVRECLADFVISVDMRDPGPRSEDEIGMIAMMRGIAEENGISAILSECFTPIEARRVLEYHNGLQKAEKGCAV